MFYPKSFKSNQITSYASNSCPDLLWLVIFGRVPLYFRQIQTTLLSNFMSPFNNIYRYSGLKAASVAQLVSCLSSFIK